MIFGFTGTQRGMTQSQKDSLVGLLGQCCEQDEFHHGDCVGADAEAHELAEALRMHTVAHPPTNPDKRAHKRATQVLEPKEYLERNKDIVQVAEAVIACPGETGELLRSGTWATIRYCRLLGRPLYIIWPDGSIRREFVK